MPTVTTHRGRAAGQGSRERGLGPVRIPPVSLLKRVLLVNCSVLLAAAISLALTPATVSRPIALQEAVVIVAGLSVLVVANLFLLRRAFAPLQRLTELMGRVDHLRPGLRIPNYGGGAEIAELTRAFNQMLDRLEAERRASWQRAIEAQEGERLRVAQELHDEVGQSLTALKLLLSRARRGSPAAGDDALSEAAQITETTLSEVREIARRLRPEALDELGLGNALAVLADRTASYGGLSIKRRLQPELPPLSRHAEVVVYRVAQESLTNVIRHAEASRVVIELDRIGDSLLLSVSDNGQGLNGSQPGHGIKGMYERALTIGGELTVQAGGARGTEVRLRVPLEPQVEVAP